MYFEFKFATSKALLINHELNALKTDTTNLKATKKTSKQKKLLYRKRKYAQKQTKYIGINLEIVLSLAKIIKPSHSMYEYFYEQAELSAKMQRKQLKLLK